MKITVLSHNLSSNSVMRAHRLATAARHFADVTLLGPVEPKGLWPALPPESWICTVPEKRFPGFHRSFLELAALADGDVLVACKPMLASYAVALVAAERRGNVPVVLDMDDLDVAFTPRKLWNKDPSVADLRRPASAVYVSLLTRASSAASAITVTSTHLQRRFGGTLVPHGSAIDLDPSTIDRNEARREFGFETPIVLFAGTPRWHKGLKPLAKAVRKIHGARLAVLCRPEDLTEAEWKAYPLIRLPLVPYSTMPRLIRAADVVAIPQLETEAACYQMPMKVYDCMAVGAPIVATSVSDMPEVLQGCAKLVPPGDSKALRCAIKELLQDPEKACALGERARARCAAQFSIRHVAERLAGVIHKVLPASPSRGCSSTRTTKPPVRHENFHPG